MKPAPLDYLAPASVPDAVRALAADEGARVIAGGQSLMPLLALRLARPTVLVDINGLGLDGFTVDAPAGTVAVGALVRHRRLELDPAVARAVPLLAAAAPLIGYPAIRNRGTIGGSLAHADPVAELPAVLVALAGTVVVTGVAGDREVTAARLFDGFLSTTLAPDELIVEVRLPWAGPDRHGAAFCEWSPRSGDFAEVGVAVTLHLDAARACAGVGAAACGAASVPVPLTEVVAGAGLLGATGLGDSLLRSVARAVTTACTGAGADRAELAGLLAARAVARAHRQASGPDRVAA